MLSNKENRQHKCLIMSTHLKTLNSTGAEVKGLRERKIQLISFEFLLCAGYLGIYIKYYFTVSRQFGKTLIVWMEFKSVSI